MITEHLVDGVPTLVAPAPGPIRAGLMFRVGEADETLATHGITHLLEHLALHDQTPADYHANGLTGAATTQFVVQGDAEAVTTYFERVGNALANLPYHRLDAEKDILRVEARWRGGAINDIPMWRHGAQSYGLAGMPEFGLLRIAADDVEAWRRRWFTRANVVLWISGCDQPPAGLRITLPDGVRMQPPMATSSLPTTPAYFNGSSGVAVADMRVEPGAAASVYTELLQRTLYRRLRRDSAVSYTTQAIVVPRDEDTCIIRALVDGLSDTMDASMTGLIEVVQSFAAGGVDEAEVAVVAGTLAKELDQPHTDAARLTGEAFNVLIGATVSLATDRAAQIRSVRAADVVRVAEQGAASALYMIPEGYHLMRYGVEAAPTGSRFAVSGQAYRSKTHRENKLVIGSDGLSMVAPSSIATVTFDKCVASLAYPDGARSLIGTDGVQINVEPAVFGVSSAEMRRIDAAVDANVVIPMAERPEATIPAITPRVHVQAFHRSFRRAVFHWGVKRAATQYGTRYQIAVAVSTLVLVGVGEWGFAHHNPVIGAAGAIACVPVAIMLFRVIDLPRYGQKRRRRPQ